MADNQQSGVHYEPSLSRIEQRELVRWIAAAPERKLLLPSAGAEVELRQDEPVYLITSGADRATDKVYNIRVSARGSLLIQYMYTSKHDPKVSCFIHRTAEVSV